MQQATRWQIIAALPAVACVAFGIAIVDIRGRSQATDALQNRSNEVIKLLDLTLTQLKDLEGGRRGFQITHDSAFLQPYMAAIPALAARQREIDAYAATGYRSDVFRRLNDLIDEKMAIAAGSDETGPGSIEATVRGKVVMDSIRDLIRDASALERQHSATFTKAHYSYVHRLGILIGIGSLFAIGGSATTIAILARYGRRTGNLLAEQRRANLELQEQAVELELTAAELEESNEIIRHRELRFRTLIEHSSDVVFVHGEDSVITFVSDNVMAVLGYSPEELTGTTGFFIVHPDDVPNAHVGFAQMMEANGGRVTWKARVRHKNGDWRFVSISGRDLSNDGIIDGVVTNVRDITESTNLEEQLRQSQKMDAMGRLAGGISHDFNNILTAIKGGTHFALQVMHPDHPAYADVMQVATSADRAAALTRQLLSFSRKQPVRVQPVDIGALITALDAMVRRLVDRRIDIRVDTEDNLPLTLADPVQLEQVFINLIVNARDAMPDGGRLAITARSVNGDGGEPQIEVEVADTGTGMDAETQARLFEPFFTTKEAGKGTGLGLATVYGIVAQLGGTIRVQSEPGEGTSFQIRLNATRSRDAHPSPTEPQPARAIPMRTAAVLVVDDDEGVRRYAARVLTSAGYRVLEADRPDAALQVLAANHVNVLLTDMAMPGMSGFDLATAAVAENPAIAVIMMSGYSETEVSPRTGSELPFRFIEKPFGPDTLMNAVVAAGQPDVA